MQTAHIVKTHVFEGPLDLMLELIEKRKLLINDVSLAQVADDYIAQVNAMDQMSVGDTAEFISLAATLLLIKSRSLLPTLTVSEEESYAIKELEYRLASYQIIKDAAGLVGRSSEQPTMHECAEREVKPIFLFDQSLTLESLREAAQMLVDGFPKLLALPKVEVKKIRSLEDVIENMTQRITSAFKMSFKDFASPAAAEEGKYGIIVSFLALLELVKQGIIQAEQQEHFGDITLESDTVSIPSYE